MELESIYLNDNEIEQYGIKISQMSAVSRQQPKDSKASRFFEPFPDEEFKQLYQHPFEFGGYDLEPGISGPLGFARDVSKHLAESIPKKKRRNERISSLLDAGIWEHTSYGHRTTKGLYQANISSPTDYEWRIHGVWSPRETDEPHIVLFSIHNLVPEKGKGFSVTRGEVILLLRMILERIESGEAKYEIYPVLMVSFFRQSVRIAQAHFDGEHIHMQVAPFIDFVGYDKANLDLLLRHILSKPTGDARMPTKSVQVYKEKAKRAQASPAQKSAPTTRLPNRPVVK